MRATERINFMQSIKMDNLTFTYKNSPAKRIVLEKINFYSEGNENIGLIGANGVGKSTFLKLLVGLNLDYEGSILINNIPVKKGNLPEVRKNVGYVFQDSESQLFMSTVYEDVSFAPRNYKFSKKEVEERTLEALEKVNITNLKDRTVYSLSGGEKKLAAIAGILAMKPDIILMDEPTIALDPRNRRNLINVLKNLKGLKIIASHDLDMILDTCERTILMNNGRIIEDGKTEDILKDKVLLEENGLELPLSIYK